MVRDVTATPLGAGRALMNPAGIHQIVGNCCAGLAAVIYAIPLQYLLLEMSRKRVDGGAIFAGAILLLPMWLLLMAALSCVTASGGFDWLRLSRGVLYGLTILATMAMAAVSFLRFELSRQPSFIDRIVGSLPIHLFPILTLLLVVFSLNPRLTRGLPLQIVNLPWTLVAALNLAICGGFLGYRLVVAGTRQLAGIGHRFQWSSGVARKHLAQIPEFDPERDFTELVRLTHEFESHAVRDAAVARVRRHPDFVARLAVELTTGRAEHALATVEYGAFTPEEQKLLAEPARKAMRRWGSTLFRALAKKLSPTGVDFQPAIDAFEQTFENRGVTAD